MFINYFSSGGFIGSAIFIIGLWFGVLRAYEIYRHKRSLMIFITLSTMVIPVLTYVFFIINGQAKYAEIQAMYGAIVGFLIPALYAEYVMNSEKRGNVQSVSPVQLGEKRKIAIPMSHAKPAEERKTVMPIATAKPVEERKIAIPMSHAKPVEERKTAMPITTAKPIEERKIAMSISRTKPVEERKTVTTIARAKPVEKRKTEQPLSPQQLGVVRNQVRENVTLYRNLRIALYACLLLFVVLFPPYIENWTHDRAWVFITSANVRPLFTFDFAFLMYELILLAVIFSGIEFWRSQL